MQKIFLILAALSVFFAFSAVAAAQDKTADKKDVKSLEAIYKKFDTATKKRDLKTFEKYMDEAFEVQQGYNKISRAQTLEIMKEFFSSAIEITEAVSKIEKIKVTGGNYTVEISSMLKGKFKMPDGTISNLEIRNNSTDVWIKNGKDWKQISQIDRGSKILADGKEAPM